MVLLKDFVLQLTLIVIPIFIYFTFISEKVESDKKRNVVMSILWGISIFFCMSFPVSLGSDARLDLRFIPLLIGTLYGGVWSGISLSALIILYRLSFGVSIGFYNTFYVLLFSMPVIFYFQKTYAQSYKDKKVKIVVGLSLYYCMLGIVAFVILRGFSLNDLLVQMIHLSLIVIVTCFFILLIEKIREIHQLRKEMQNAEKFRVISELTSIFAHEIRNPMQVARGFLQILDDPDMSMKKKEYIKISIEELDRANEIIHDFLSIGKPTINSNERINVGYQLQRVVNILQSYSRNHNVEIKTNIVPNLWIHANPQKFSQSLINILKNAIESMLNGGIVWVTCTVNDDKFIKVVIKDQGVGMTKKEIDMLGLPFYSLKKSGTGLGLMISFQIIRSFKGKIIVKSEKDLGTEFIISFPKIPESTNAEKES